MARITRKSYKRKKIVLGLCMFASIALISTGFAAWILSSGASADKDGNITVGVVDDCSVEFFGLNYEGKFCFDAKQEDIKVAGKENRLYYKPGSDFESLTVTVSGYVSNADIVTDINVAMEVSDKVIQAATAIGENYVVDENTSLEGKGYITLPDCAIKNQTSTAVSITNDNGKIEDITINESNIETYKAMLTNKGEVPNLKNGDKIRRFEYDITFGWGEKFGGDNPGIWYDDPKEDRGGEKIKDPNSQTVKYIYKIDDDTVKTVMNDLRETLNSESYVILLNAAV